VDHGPAGIETFFGMTLRQYAAIKLKVPDSGTDWLDDMIRESLRAVETKLKEKNT
jgi:hypothetical protein